MSSEKCTNSLGGTSITIEQVQRVLQRHFNTNNAIKGHTSTRIADAKGNLSDIVKITLQWVDSGDELPGSVVAKVPSMDKLLALGQNMGDATKEHIDRLSKKIDLVKTVRLHSSSFQSAFFSDIPLRGDYLRNDAQAQCARTNPSVLRRCFA